MAKRTQALRLPLSGLLARKGAARPAMKPQGFGQMGGGSLEDLGWNDMGFEPPKPAEAPRDATHDAFGDDVVEHPRAHPTGLTPVGSPVHEQQAEIEDRFGAAMRPRTRSTTPPSRTSDDRPDRGRGRSPRACRLAAPTPAEPCAATALGSLEPRAKPPSPCGSTRRDISSCASPAPSTDARRSKSSQTRSTGCSLICRNSTPWPRRPNARDNSNG